MAFPNTSVLDDFNRADEDPLSGGGLWTTPLVRLDFNAALISNVADNTHGWASAYRNNISPTDLEVFCTIPATAGAGNVTKLYWRITNPNNVNFSGYSAEFNVNDHIKVYEITNEVYTQLADIDTSGVGGVDNGDQVGIQMVGNTIKVFVNGTQVGSDITNSAHTGSGRIGFEQFSLRGVDDFGGGAYTGSAPTNATPPAIVGSPVVGTATGYGSDTWNNSPTSFTRQWLIETAIASGSYANIPGATAATYTPTSGDVGKKLKVTVTATNAFGSASSTSAATAAVQSGLGAGSAFPSTAVRDDCTRADEAPLSNSGNWTSPINVGDYALKLLSNQIISNGAGWGSAYWNAANFGPNCEVYAQMDSVGDTGWEYRLWLNVSNPNNSTRTGYQARFIKYVGVEIWRYDGAVAPTKIASFTGISWTTDAVVGVRRVGATLLAFVNNTLVGQVDDSTYAVSGRIGVEIYSTGSGFRSFGGGSYTGPVTPPFTPRIWWYRRHMPSTSFVVQSSLSGTLTVPVEWAAIPSEAVVQVDFLIDGVTKWTERIAPYIFNGDPGGMLDPATLTNGQHTFTIVATAADGRTAVSSQTLTVNVSGTPPPPPPAGTTPGRVNFWMYATSQADYLVTGGRPTAADKAFEQAKWQRVEVWIPDFNSYLPGRTMRYNDCIGIYAGSSTLSQHPEWVLRDVNGNMLTFFANTQYLADPGNLAYQTFKANEIAAYISQGYHGVKIDDVNQNAVTNPSAVNPRTGQLYTLAQWQKDIADLITKIRTTCKALDVNFEIAGNALWWSSGADVDRCINQLDLFQLERGFNDTNYSASSIQQVWAFVDKLHGKGIGAIHLSEASGTQATHFNLACALLSSDGRDYVYGEGWRPESYDTIYDTNLGDALGARFNVSGNLWRRNFALGYVTADLAAKVGTIVKT